MSLIYILRNTCQARKIKRIGIGQICSGISQLSMEVQNKIHSCSHEHTVKNVNSHKYICKYADICVKLKSHFLERLRIVIGDKIRETFAVEQCKSLKLERDSY